MSEFFKFELSCGHLVMILIILEGFPESLINCSFQPSWPCRKSDSFDNFTFLHISPPNQYFFFHFSNPMVSWWWFSSFSKAFQKVEKIKVFNDRRPVEKASLCCFPNFAYFSSKWVNFYIWVVLWSSGDNFHHFRRLSRKWKQLKFLMTADLSKWPIFATLQFLHISYPNEWILTFELSCGNLVMMFIILEGFPESRKNLSYRPSRPCQKRFSFAYFTFLHTFLLQISKFLHLSCPVVIW